MLGGSGVYGSNHVIYNLYHLTNKDLKHLKYLKLDFCFTLPL